MFDIKKILVVDNNKVVLRLMTHLLEELGYEVRSAVDGLDALDVLSGFQADLLFIDLVMPKINGEKLCRILRSRPETKDAFLVIFSAIVAESQVDFKGFGADACIAKGPFKEVREHIKKVLAQARTSHPLQAFDGVDISWKIHEREITKELLSTKKHFEVILNCISDAFFELTPDGNIVYLNSTACKMIGKPEESLLARNFADLFPADQYDRINELLAKIDCDPLTIGEDESFFLNGKQVLLSLVNVIDADSGFLVAVISDISRRKAAERKVKEQQGNLELLVEKRTRELIQANEKLQHVLNDRKQLLDEKEALERKLEEALTKIKTLSG